MTEWSGVFLGMIAAATLVMALIQVGAVIYGARMARRVEALSERLERDIAPLVQRLTVITEDAARVSSLAVGQVERLDRVTGDLAGRLTDVAATVHAVLARPARGSFAFAAAVRAAYLAVRTLRDRRRGGNGRFGEEEDALFIG